MSRKSFLPLLTGSEQAAAQRDVWSHHVHALIAPCCSILRVHDVVGAREALAISRELQLNLSKNPILNSNKTHADFAKGMQHV